MAQPIAMTQAERDVMMRGPVNDPEAMGRWIVDVAKVFGRRFNIPPAVSHHFGRFYVEAVTRQAILKRHVERVTQERQQIATEYHALQDKMVDMHRQVVLSQLKSWELSSLIDVMSLDMDTLTLPTSEDIKTGFYNAAP